MTTIPLSTIPLPTLNQSNSNLPSNPPKFPQNYSSKRYSKRLFHAELSSPVKPELSRNCSANEADPLGSGSVEVLRVPDHWLEPSNAVQESEWLRVALHKWLDDEYCPEPTNVDISRVAANSYYQSLLQKITDLGEILLRMIRELESISYQESFHGAFSSANAAVSLIAERIEHD